jgi:ASC-1-like (ASCH) protein
MVEIKKKTWPKYFQEVLDGKKKFEVRLADFEVKEGDILVLEEYDGKTKKYTGRIIRKKVNFVTKFNPLDAHSLQELKKFGLYEIGLE